MDNKIDVAEGKHGYERIESELDKVIRLLKRVMVSSPSTIKVIPKIFMPISV